MRSKRNLRSIMQPLMEKVRKSHDASLSAFVRRERQFPFQWHYHREYELTLITAGRGRRFVGDHIADFREGDLILLGPLLPHTWRSEASHAARRRAIVVQFPEDFLGTALKECTELINIQKLLCRSRLGLQFLGRRRAKAAKQLEPLIKMRGARKLAEFVSILDGLAKTQEVSPLASEAYAVPSQKFTSRRMAGVLKTIHRNYQQRLSQTDLARSVGLSDAAFIRNFRRATGTTLIDYINDLRIGHACRMLAESADLITDICFESGFTNLSNFNRCFLRRRGMTPSQFRSQFQR